MNGEDAAIKKLVIAAVPALLLFMSPGTRGEVIETNYAGDVLMWNHITSSGPAAEFSGTPRGIILPHHTITATMAARFYRGLARRVKPRRIIIIAPNHYESGGSDIITAKDCVYKTVYGDLEIDRDAARELAEKHGTACDDSVFSGEHSVYFHSPFIKKFFPQAKILPVLVKWNTARGELDSLVESLEGLVMADTLILASVDFSHYNMRYTADFHDESSCAAIVNFDYDTLFASEIDSPGSIYVLEKLMALEGVRRCERIYHTNSEDFIGRTIDNTTSHQYFAFYRGRPRQMKIFTVLITGNIHWEGCTLGVMREWRWDRSYNPGGDLTITRYLSGIRGEEDRFLAGYNLYIFDVKPGEGERIYSINGIDAGIIAYRPGDKRGVNSLIAVRALADKTVCTIVMVHAWGDSESAMKKTAKTLVDSGADIVVFRNPGVKPSHEYYKGKPVIYSLGDFINPGKDSEGEICQVLFTQKKITTNYIPVEITGGFPREKGRSAGKSSG